MASEAVGRPVSDLCVLEVRDSHGSTLTFTVTDISTHEWKYGVAIDVGWARASAEVSTYLYGPPTAFFESLAQSWKGWEGEKTWEDLEKRIGFSATCDRTGHVTLEVLIRDSGYTGRVVLPMYLEAGSLEVLAARVRKFFAEAPPQSQLPHTRGAASEKTDE